MDFKIVDATSEDAEFIAEGIMHAVGDDLVDNMAGSKTREDVKNVFKELALRLDSQYSYSNSRVAELDNGKRIGVCVSYPGEFIIELRRSFFEVARRVFDWSFTDEEVESLPGETSSDEYYLDSLYTVPEYRGSGVGRALIADAKKRAEKRGLPLGLLVADDNYKARKLYESLGFKAVGRRLFAGEEMTNMRI